MAVDMRVNGMIIIWRVWVFMFGMMVECIKVNIKTIKNMASEFILGSMAAVMKVTGIEVNNMV